MAQLPHADEAVRTRSQAFVDLMIPVVKGWCTENANLINFSDGVQVHGGMGFIEEVKPALLSTGCDARIIMDYEGNFNSG